MTSLVSTKNSINLQVVYGSKKFRNFCFIAITHKRQHIYLDVWIIISKQVIKDLDLIPCWLLDEYYLVQGNGIFFVLNN